MFDRGAFLFGADPWNYLNHEEPEMRDFGSFMYLTNRSDSVIDLWHECYVAKTWLVGIDLPDLQDIPSMKRRLDPLALLVENFRGADSANDIETGSQKWLLVCGSERFVLLINGTTYSCAREQDASWETHQLNLENWDLNYQKRLMGELTSIHLGTSSDESDSLREVVETFSLALIVNDPDFEQEISDNEHLGDEVYGVNYNWPTSYGVRIYCHLSNPDYLFGGAISPNPSSEFRRLEVFFKVLDDIGFKGLPEIGANGYLIGESTDPGDLDIHLMAPYFDLSGNLYGILCSLRDVQRSEEVQALASKFNLDLDIQALR